MCIRRYQNDTESCLPAWQLCSCAQEQNCPFFFGIVFPEMWKMYLSFDSGKVNNSGMLLKTTQWSESKFVVSCCLIMLSHPGRKGLCEWFSDESMPKIWVLVGIPRGYPWLYQQYWPEWLAQRSHCVFRERTDIAALSLRKFGLVCPRIVLLTCGHHLTSQEQNSAWAMSLKPVVKQVTARKDNRYQKQDIVAR